MEKQNKNRQREVEETKLELTYLAEYYPVQSLDKAYENLVKSRMPLRMQCKDPSFGSAFALPDFALLSIGVDEVRTCVGTFRKTRDCAEISQERGIQGLPVRRLTYILSK